MLAYALNATKTLQGIPTWVGKQWIERIICRRWGPARPKVEDGYSLASGASRWVKP